MKLIRYRIVLVLFSFSAIALSSCRHLPPPATACVDFQLGVGTRYGPPVVTAPGTVVFTSNGIPVSVHPFTLQSGGRVCDVAHIDNAPFAFGTGQSIQTNNINLEFDFTRLGVHAV